MMAQRSFISQARQARQQVASTHSTPPKDGMSPMAAKSRRSFPITRRLQIDGPTSRTMAVTNIGTRQATGVILTSDIRPPHGCSVYGGCRFRNEQAEKFHDQRQHSGKVKLLRGHMGALPHDCIRHDDYRSADFAGPLVPA